MSIIPKKYAEKYKGKEKDWVTQFIDRYVTKPVTKVRTTKAEDGTVSEETVTLKKTSLDLGALFDLAKANKIDEKIVSEMEAQRDRPNAPGRIRMTLGNSLRAAARQRHGLNDLNGEFHSADAAFIGDAEKTHNPDGSKIVPPKVETTEQAA